MIKNQREKDADNNARINEAAAAISMQTLEINRQNMLKYKEDLDRQRA